MITLPDDTSIQTTLSINPNACLNPTPPPLGNPHDTFLIMYSAIKANHNNSINSVTMKTTRTSTKHYQSHPHPNPRPPQPPYHPLQNHPHLALFILLITLHQ